MRGFKRIRLFGGFSFALLFQDLVQFYEKLVGTEIASVQALVKLAHSLANLLGEELLRLLGIWLEISCKCSNVACWASARRIFAQRRGSDLFSRENGFVSETTRLGLFFLVLGPLLIPWLHVLAIRRMRVDCQVLNCVLAEDGSHA